MPALMKLGDYTFALNPGVISDPFEEFQSAAVVQTYSAAAFFSWGFQLIGREVSLEWEHMSTAQYDSMYQIYKNNAMVVFDPAGQINFKFNVRIVSFTGKYFLDVVTGTKAYRKDVKLDLIIMGVA